MLEPQKSVLIRLKSGRYDIVILEKSYKSKSENSGGRELLICHSSDKFLKRKKMPPL